MSIREGFPVDLSQDIFLFVHFIDGMGTPFMTG